MWSGAPGWVVRSIHACSAYGRRRREQRSTRRHPGRDNAGDEFLSASGLVPPGCLPPFVPPLGSENWGVCRPSPRVAGLRRAPELPPDQRRPREPRSAARLCETHSIGWGSSGRRFESCQPDKWKKTRRRSRASFSLSGTRCWEPKSPREARACRVGGSCQPDK
jgi:hypothetical protein